MSKNITIFITVEHFNILYSKHIIIFIHAQKYKNTQYLIFQCDDVYPCLIFQILEKILLSMCDSVFLSDLSFLLVLLLGKYGWLSEGKTPAEGLVDCLAGGLLEAP